MVEPTRRMMDRAVEESMDLFNRARVGSVAPIDPSRPKTVLLALDGSQQDVFGIEVARQFRERLVCELNVVDAREGILENDLALEVAGTLGGQAEPKTADDSFAQILTAVGHSKCDLVITPCPYGRDLESVGPDSAGTVIDVLLARLSVPVLAIRKPYSIQDDLFRHVTMVLTAENEAAPAAAAWACGLIAPHGSFQLALVLEQEMHENISALMQSIAPDVDVTVETLSNALAKSYMRLHRSLKKTAAQGEFEYQLHLLVEGETEAVVEDEASPTLIVLALERDDHASQGNVQSRIRQTRHPVLVVSQQAYDAVAD